jgi:hypothetical protein
MGFSDLRCLQNEAELRHGLVCTGAQAVSDSRPEHLVGCFSFRPCTPPLRHDPPTDNHIPGTIFALPAYHLLQHTQVFLCGLPGFLRLTGLNVRLFHYRTDSKSHVTFRTGGATIGPRPEDVYVTGSPIFQFFCGGSPSQPDTMVCAAARRRPAAPTLASPVPSRIVTP